MKKFDINFLTAPIRHGDFHNRAFLLIFACAAALVLRLAGMKFGAHMFEDPLIANPPMLFSCR